MEENELLVTETIGTKLTRNPVIIGKSTNQKLNLNKTRILRKNTLSISTGNRLNVLNGSMLYRNIRTTIYIYGGNIHVASYRSNSYIFDYIYNRSNK